MKALYFVHRVTWAHAVHAQFLLFTLLLVACALCVGQARADPSLKLVTPDEMRGGGLLFSAAEEGRYVQAPLLGTDIDIQVSGPTARARVTQRFRNPASGWVEGVYVFPLPENSAVDTLKMVIGDRVVIGEVKERVAAKVVYEQAKAAGQKTGLIEQERPNMFTTSVANIGPGETVVIQLEYQQSVAQAGGVFALRAPLVVAPRYNPAPVVQTVEFAEGAGWAANDAVPDRKRIEPPNLDPSKNSPVNPVTLSVRLNAGFALGEVKSHHHKVAVEAVSDDSQVLKLDGAVAADRDFQLTWTPKSGRAPSAGLFRERIGVSDYVLGMITPPTVEAGEDRRPRETIFVIDNSGSMGGESIKQAKESLLFGLARLQPGDTFNVIRFDNTMETVFSSAVAADAKNVAYARRFVGRLEASGGTEMVPAMQAALIDPRTSEANRLRQVVFLTDGAIGNEQQLFETIAAGRGRSRVFMIGIGSAPNSHLMTRAAELGRGSFLHIGSPDQVEERMRELFGKLEAPAVTNITAKFSRGGADVTPELLPDLYRGETLTFAAKLDSLDGAVTITGMIGDTPWMVSIPLAKAADGAGVSKLWARRKISDAEVAATLQKTPREAADALILALALDHHLVSRLTSLVAIDKTPSRPAGERLSRAYLPLNLPAGWDFVKVFGEQRKAERDVMRLDEREIGGRIRTSATAPAPVNQSQQMVVRLPKTATPAQLMLMAGLALLLASA
ncbi:MAG: marine proteobacterial sortase target protein, partial [Chitinophagales bacterium]|nr:marine proteobacterial sortase target protein [Hyphomicrobiales bacterium]